MTDAETPRLNAFEQPIGPDVPDWHGAARPDAIALEGRYCRLEPLSVVAHLDDLWEAFSLETTGRMWTYMPYGPFADRAAFETWMDGACKSADPLFCAILDVGTGRAVGSASYLRITPENGAIEVGNIAYSPRLQRTPIATDAMYLMMRHVFEDLGYRRYEWKCDALNAPSHAAAKRLGFTYDGLFRQALVYKGRNRDTAWYSVLDRDWPRLRQGFEAWLAPDNIGPDGQQRASLGKSFPMR